MTYLQQIRAILAPLAHYGEDCDCDCGCPVIDGEPVGCSEVEPWRCEPEVRAAARIGRGALLARLRAEEGPAYDPVQCEALVGRLFGEVPPPSPEDLAQGDLFRAPEV